MTGWRMQSGAITSRPEWSVGAAAYIDRDWMTADRDVPALVAAKGVFRWRDDEVAIPEGADEDTAALAVMLVVAQEAVDAIDRSADVRVVGEGVIAWAVREQLGHANLAEDDPPSAVIETTGDPATLAEASRTLIDGGTLVLLGETLGRAYPFNLYPDVHRRGIKVVGVRPPLADHDVASQVGAAQRLIHKKPPLGVTIGGQLQDAAWYRLGP